MARPGIEVTTQILQFKEIRFKRWLHGCIIFALSSLFDKNAMVLQCFNLNSGSSGTLLKCLWPSNTKTSQT